MADNSIISVFLAKRGMSSAFRWLFQIFPLRHLHHLLIVNPSRSARVCSSAVHRRLFAVPDLKPVTLHFVPVGLKRREEEGPDGGGESRAGEVHHDAPHSLQGKRTAELFVSEVAQRAKEKPSFDISPWTLPRRPASGTRIASRPGSTKTPSSTACAAPWSRSSRSSPSRGAAGRARSSPPASTTPSRTSR